MKAFCETIRAQASEGLTFTESVHVAVTPDFGSEILVTCALQQVNQQGANGQAQVSITGYIQDGKTNQGSWPLLIGKNITDVTSSLAVTSTAAVATVIIIGYE
jgi:hypothetical protein